VQVRGDTVTLTDLGDFEARIMTMDTELKKARISLEKAIKEAKAGLQISQRN